MAGNGLPAGAIPVGEAPWEKKPTIGLPEGAIPADEAPWDNPETPSISPQEYESNLRQAESLLGPSKLRHPEVAYGEEDSLTSRKDPDLIDAGINMAKEMARDVGPAALAAGAGVIAAPLVPAGIIGGLAIAGTGALVHRLSKEAQEAIVSMPEFDQTALAKLRQQEDESWWMKALDSALSGSLGAWVAAKRAVKKGAKVVDDAIQTGKLTPQDPGLALGVTQYVDDGVRKRAADTARGLKDERVREILKEEGLEKGNTVVFNKTTGQLDTVTQPPPRGLEQAYDAADGNVSNMSERRDAAIKALTDGWKRLVKSGNKPKVGRFDQKDLVEKVEEYLSAFPQAEGSDGKAAFDAFLDKLNAVHKNVNVNGSPAKTLRAVQDVNDMITMRRRFTGPVSKTDSDMLYDLILLKKQLAVHADKQIKATQKGLKARVAATKHMAKPFKLNESEKYLDNVSIVDSNERIAANIYLRDGLNDALQKHRKTLSEYPEKVERAVDPDILLGERSLPKRAWDAFGLGDRVNRRNLGRDMAADMSSERKKMERLRNSLSGTPDPYDVSLVARQALPGSVARGAGAGVVAGPTQGLIAPSDAHAQGLPPSSLSSVVPPLGDPEAMGVDFATPPPPPGQLDIAPPAIGPGPITALGTPVAALPGPMDVPPALGGPAPLPNELLEEGPAKEPRLPIMAPRDSEAFFSLPLEQLGEFPEEMQNLLDVAYLAPEPVRRMAMAKVMQLNKELPIEEQIIFEQPEHDWVKGYSVVDDRIVDDNEKRTFNDFITQQYAAGKIGLLQRGQIQTAVNAGHPVVGYLTQEYPDGAVEVTSPPMPSEVQVESPSGEGVTRVEYDF